MGQFQDLRIPAILLSLTVLGCSGPGTDPVTVTDVTTTDASEVLDGMGDGETDGMVAEDVTAPWLPLDDCAPACAALAEELGGCWQVGCESPEGECMSAMRAEETPCGTEDACHTPGACVEGTCEGAVATDCDDDNLCTEEQCDPELGCVYTSLDVDGCEIPEGCGDDVCEHAAGEWCDTCPDDCGGCSGSDCCSAQTSPGCSEAAIETCVCEGWDGFCCQVTWDETCVTLAKSACDAKCGVPGICGDGVCDQPGGEGCGGCPQDCGACGANPLCCTPKGEPGCVQEDIESCVCGLDPFCCDDAWDDTCVALVATCGADCDKEEGGCGDGVCKLAEQENCVDCPVDCGECGAWSNCCVAGEEAGCEDPVTQACVCEISATCCDDAWTADCADIAFSDCEADCENPPAVCGDGVCAEGDESCESCTEDCGICFNPACCEAQDSGGCGGGACEDIVCELDAYCCNNTWDGSCAGCATTGNGYDGLDCTEAIPICQCAEDYCGDGECTEGEHCVNCESDCGECPPKDCCEAQESPLCDDEGCQEEVCAIDDFCCTTLWDSDCASCATEGIGPEGVDCSEVLATCQCSCGNGECAPFENCDTCADDCGACFCGDGLCSEEEVCDLCVDDCGLCVCGDDVCSGNETCTTCDIDCGVCGADCCNQHSSAGCSSPTCQEAVCGLDPYCCDTAWDGACASCAVTGDGYGDIDCTDAVPICQCGGECGDETCDPLESCSTCPDDCGECVCGDGVCDTGEDEASCLLDCAPPGACVGDSDSTLIAEGLSDEVIIGCLQTCLFNEGDLIPCMQACTVTGTGLSEGCALCYAEGIDCLFNFCPGECLFGNDQTEACLNCQEENGCFASFDECSGLEANPPSSECGDGDCGDDEGCETCPGDCGPCPTADCCVAHGAMGCDADSCEAAVCEALPTCCEVAWDDVCVACAEGDGAAAGATCDEALFACECVNPI